MEDARFPRIVRAARLFRDRVFPEHGEDFARLATSQDPVALFITCADSRISPEMITEAAPGDLFVSRNVGNLDRERAGSQDQERFVFRRH